MYNIALVIWATVEVKIAKRYNIKKDTCLYGPNYKTLSCTTTDVDSIIVNYEVFRTHAQLVAPFRYAEFRGYESRMRHPRRQLRTVVNAIHLQLKACKEIVMAATACILHCNLDTCNTVERIMKMVGNNCNLGSNYDIARISQLYTHWTRRARVDTGICRIVVHAFVGVSTITACRDCVGRISCINIIKLCCLFEHYTNILCRSCSIDKI